MSFDSERKRLGRQPMRVVSLAFDNGTEVFCDREVPHGKNWHPALEKIDLAPTRLKPGEGLPDSGTVRLTLRDWPHPDGRGTYLARMIATNQYYLERVMTVDVGYLAPTGYDPGDFSSRTYFIESIDGPDEKGKVVVKAKDALKSLHDSGSKIPLATKGKLQSAITASQTGLIDIGDVENLPASGFARVEDEVLAYSSISGTSLDVTARAQFGTTAASHDAGEAVRWWYGFINKNVVNLIEDVLVKFGGVDAAYIPSSEWYAERDKFLSAYNLTGGLSDPEETKKFINQVCKECSINLWWDERAQEIRLRAWGPQLNNDFQLTDEHLLEDNAGSRERAEIERDLDERTTQIWYYYDKKNATGRDEQSNFDDLVVDADLALEASDKYGKKAVRVIKGAFVTTQTVAAGVSARLNIRRKHGRTTLRFSLDAADADMWTGDIGLLTTDLIQYGDDADTPGAPRPVQIIITSVQEEDGHVYRYEAEIFKFEPPLKYFVVGPNDLPDYTEATTEQRAKYGWVADTATEELSNGDEFYAIT